MPANIKRDYKEIINIFSYWDKDLLFLEENGYDDFASEIREVMDKYKYLYNDAVKCTN